MMFIYRIAKSERRVNDLSGMGAYKEGGRWNNPGTYMLYTSENSSLAYLENLVHFEPENAVPDLYIMCIELKVKDTLIYTLPEKEYPRNWHKIGNLDNKDLGDQLMKELQFMCVKVKSAVNPTEYNYFLNPLFPRYHDLVEVITVDKLSVDRRLI